MSFWQLAGSDKRDVLIPQRHMRWIQEAVLDPTTIIWQTENRNFVICGGEQAMLIEQVGRLLFYTLAFISLSPYNRVRCNT